MFLRSMHRNHPNHLLPVKGNKQAKHAPLKDRKWASEGQAAALQGEQQQQQAAGGSGHVRAEAGAVGSSRTGGRAGLAATATSWLRATRGQSGPRDLVPVRGKRRWSPLRPREPPALQSALSPGRLRSLSLAMTGAVRAIAQTRVTHHSEPAKIEADNG